MMKSIKKEIRQNSSIHNKIRGASFVLVESEQTKRLKYLLNFFRIEKFKQKMTSLKRSFMSVIQFTGLWINKVDWKGAREFVSIWMIEAFIEGLTANFATHYLLGFQFNVKTILAHGIIIRQGLSIFWRLKQNGPSETILNKHE